MKHLHLLALIAAISALPTAATAQCRAFVKNKCAANMLPYKFNETFNAAQLGPGEEAEVDLTFFSGQDYRLMVCAHPIIGEVNWKLMDGTGQTLFESLASAPKPSFEFKVATTQKLKVHIDVPEDKSSATEMLNYGCVGILVGFKE
ncbi:MAG: hypothetical protein JST41_07965 [Bacteroidetes bacterium]|nr:hypothetical protein [Bacteroidota bacterium]MBX7130005.1 hypothetical protein [Flavobacteriales bacterium]MCC6654438.1 hypothetical protein [Flavobacteriales bacterium]HMU12801.1 hypothetical protein [Flavobacteriales bacterium]HMW95764.1 hypothetical protein [Flavobacteriales bacterium]